MSDYSTAVISSILFLGSGFAFLVGYAMRGPKGCGGVIGAAFLALFLAVFIMFSIGGAWNTCAKTFRLCAATSDTTVWNIVLLPLIQIPINWLSMLAFPRASDIENAKAQDAKLTRVSDAIGSAIRQFRTGAEVFEVCPECRSKIFVALMESRRTEAAIPVRTSCNCGICRGEFKVAV
jgi:hypothetical protein